MLVYIYKFQIGSNILGRIIARMKLFLDILLKNC